MVKFSLDYSLCKWLDGIYSMPGELQVKFCLCPYVACVLATRRMLSKKQLLHLPSDSRIYGSC